MADATSPAPENLAAKPTEVGGISTAPAALPAVKTTDLPPTAQEEEVSDSIFGEFFLFLKEEKKWWLAPLITVLLLLSAIIIFAEGSAIAPFIYTIF